MAVGDCERAFHDAAARDGLILIRSRHPWLNGRGHLGLPSSAGEAIGALEQIFLTLGGDLVALAAKPARTLPGDFFHEASGTLIEIDEHQHFTTARLDSLRLYPPITPLGYDMEDYQRLCARWSPVADRYFASKPAAAFGPRGRQRQRAYHDALRDLSAPALGFPPVIRVAAPDRDGALAFERAADVLRPLAGL